MNLPSKLTNDQITGLILKYFDVPEADILFNEPDTWGNVTIYVPLFRKKKEEYPDNDLESFVLFIWDRYVSISLDTVREPFDMYRSEGKDLLKDAVSLEQALADTRFKLNEMIAALVKITGLQNHTES